MPDDPPFPRSILIPIADFALGGTERVAVRLANAWGRMGCDVTLFCGRDAGPLAALIDRDTVRVTIAPGGVTRGRGSRRRLGVAAARWLRERPAEVCFIPGNYHWQAIPPLAALPASLRPRIVAQISAALVKPQRWGLRRWSFEWRLRRLLGEADIVVTLSEAALGDLRRIAPDLSGTALPLPALEDDAAPPILAAGKTIMAAGRLVPEKGFADLIDAFALVRDPDTTLTIVGAGTEAGALARRATALKLAHRISFPGYTNDIRPFLDRSRLFVLSSHYEGYAAVLVEALAAGRPVVATDCTPATADLLADERFGIVVPLGDRAAMAAAIDRLLALPPPDPTLLAAEVARHRITPVGRAYLDLFAGLGARR